MIDMIEVTNNKNLVLSSLEVAEMIEKTHANLMKDIRKYSGYLAEVKIDLGDFWEEVIIQMQINRNAHVIW